MISDRDNRIVVMMKGRASQQYIMDCVSDDTPFSWIYFGKDVSHYIELKKTIDGHGKNIAISQTLQKNAKECRQEFVDFIGSCASESKNPWWYLTATSEKNSYVSDLYLNFCYLKTFFDIIPNHNGKVFVICENPDLISSINLNSQGNPRIRSRLNITFFPRLWIMCSYKVRKFWNKSIFLMRFLVRIVIAKSLARIFHGVVTYKIKNPIIIHSWADQRSYPNNNRYTDVYFGALADRFEKTNKPYFLLIDILPTINFLFAVVKTRKIPKPWHLFEEYLTLCDPFTALVVAARAQKVPKTTKHLLAMDVSTLLKSDMWNDSRNARSELSYLYFTAGKRMAAIHAPVSVCYTFENHAWEKMFIKGIREAFQNSRIIGYAHSTVNSLELSYSISPSETGLIPLPDSILVNGKKPKKVLASSGFDENTIHIVGSLRYGKLGNCMAGNATTDKKKILVILSADINRSLEMIEKCGGAFKSSTDFFVTFKPHPIQKTTQIFRLITQLPDTVFRISTEPLSDLLRDVDVAIYSDSTASVEAVACGISVLQIRSDFLIDISIFDESEIFPSASTPEQIHALSLALCEKKNLHVNEYQQAVSCLFSSVNEEVLDREIGFGIET